MTDRIQKERERQAFLAGFGSIVSLFIPPTRIQVQLPPDYPASVPEAIARDWQIVGREIGAALERAAIDNARLRAELEAFKERAVAARA